MASSPRLTLPSLACPGSNKSRCPNQFTVQSWARSKSIQKCLGVCEQFVLDGPQTGRHAAIWSGPQPWCFPLLESGTTRTVVVPTYVNVLKVFSHLRVCVVLYHYARAITPADQTVTLLRVCCRWVERLPASHFVRTNYRSCAS